MSNTRGQDKVQFIIMAVVVVIFVLSLFRGTWVDESIAVRALEKQGYSDVQITDHSWFMVGLRGCGRSDAAKFTATAKNPVGQEIECFVCTGWLFKGATIRTD